MYKRQVKARAERRYREYLEKNVKADYDEIYRDIEQRDYQDMNREASPLRKAEDAIQIDTSDMSIEEVVKKYAGIFLPFHDRR